MFDFTQGAMNLWDKGTSGLGSAVEQGKKLVGLGKDEETEDTSEFKFDTTMPFDSSAAAKSHYTPTTSFGGYGTEGAFGNYFKPSGISEPGLSSDNVGWKPGANKMEDSNFIPTDYESAKAAEGEKGFDWEGLARTLQSIKPNKAPPISMTRSGGGGGRYDKSVFENQLLTRELNALYNQPLYTKLG